MNNKTLYKIAYLTNGVAHHISNLCEAFVKDENVSEFVLIVTSEMSEEYRRLGNDNYIDLSKIRVIDARTNPAEVSNIILSFDLVIGTYAGDIFLRKRIEIGKITFVFSERIFKKYDDNRILSCLKNIIRFYKYKKILIRGGYLENHVYFLTTGKYAFNDYKFLGVKENHIIPFGYFPKGIVERRKKCKYTESSIIHLLWVGRLVKWKHPEYSIRLYKKLRKHGYNNIDLTIIGNGKLEKTCKSLIGPKDNIKMLGGLPTNEVRSTMKKCDILLFTSNEGEGWGMVLNEGMAEGLVPIASNSAGSTTELVIDGINGFVYYNNNFNDLYNKALNLINNYSLITKMREESYKTIENKWNANNAVNIVINVFNNIQATN